MGRSLISKELFGNMLQDLFDIHVDSVHVSLDKHLNHLMSREIHILFSCISRILTHSPTWREFCLLAPRRKESGDAGNVVDYEMRALLIPIQLYKDFLRHTSSGGPHKTQSL